MRATLKQHEIWGAYMFFDEEYFFEIFFLNFFRFELETQKQVHQQNFSPIGESDPSSITTPNKIYKILYKVK